MFTFPFNYKYILKCFNSRLDYSVCATVSLSVELLIDTYVYYLCAVCICLALIPSYFSVVPSLRSAPLLLLLAIGLAVNRVRQSPHPLTKLMAGSVTNDHQSHCVGRGRGRARV